MNNESGPSKPNTWRQLDTRVAIYSTCGIFSGVIVSGSTVPTIMFLHHLAPETGPDSLFRNVQELPLDTMGLVAVCGLPLGLVAGVITAFLPRMLRHPFSLSSFWASCLGTVALLIFLSPGHRTVDQVAILTGTWLAIGGTYGLLLGIGGSVAARLVAQGHRTIRYALSSVPK